MGIFTANRLAAVAAFCTGLAAAVLAVTKSFPTNWQQTVVAIAGILGAIGTALHFMLGSQKFDATPVGQAAHAQKLGGTTPIGSGAGLDSDPSLLDQGPDANELAEPENLNSEQWLANRRPDEGDEAELPATPADSPVA